MYTQIGPLQAFTLIILILIIIFIAYTFWFMQPNVYEVISTSTVEFKKQKNEKMISYCTEYLDVRHDSAQVIYYNLPINSIYWTIGFHNDKEAINSVNMGKYRTIEKGDVLAIIIGNNKFAIEAAKNEITKEHKKKYPYKILKYHHLKINEPYYIRFESYSNKFFHYDISMKIKNYRFDKIIYEDFNNMPLPISEERYCENHEYFDLAKEKVITSRCHSIPIHIGTNEFNNSVECFTNRSDVLEIDKIIYKKDQNDNDILSAPIYPFRLVACDHFKTRAALHSHVVFFNADNNEEFRVEIISEISDSFNQKKSIAIRYIGFFLPPEVKRFYVIEYIYYDYVSGGKVHPNTIIPFELYKVI